MAVSKEELLDAIANMSVLELSELIKQGLIYDSFLWLFQLCIRFCRCAIN